MKQTIKDILDRECMKEMHHRCPVYQKGIKRNHDDGVHCATPCWTCHKNDNLAAEIDDAIKVKA